MPAQQGPIRESDVASQQAVVSHVTVGHEEIVRADDGLFPDLAGAVHGDVLAENILVANKQPGGLALVLHILRRVADDTARVKPVAGSDTAHAGEVNMGPHPAFRAERDVLVNDRESADHDGRVQLGIGVDDSGRMDHV